MILTFAPRIANQLKVGAYNPKRIEAHLFVMLSLKRKNTWAKVNSVFMLQIIELLLNCEYYSFNHHNVSILDGCWTVRNNEEWIEQKLSMVDYFIAERNYSQLLIMHFESL